jgi:hypothetical protein
VGPTCQREGSREGERAGATDGWGRAIRGERGTREMDRVGRKGGRSAGARPRGGGGKLGPDSAQSRGKCFFFFLFLFSFLFLNLFYL